METITKLSRSYVAKASCGKHKTDTKYMSIDKAWDKLFKMYKDGKLVLDSGIHTWMRLKCPKTDRTIFMESSSRWINYNKENEDLIYTILIRFEK